MPKKVHGTTALKPRRIFVNLAYTSKLPTRSMQLSQYKTFNSTEKTEIPPKSKVIKTVFKNSLAIKRQKSQEYKMFGDNKMYRVSSFIFVTHWKRKIWNYEPFFSIHLHLKCGTWKARRQIQPCTTDSPEEDMERLCVHMCVCTCA